MQLVYKFWLITDTGRVYLETLAEDKDSQWVYLKNGKIPRNMIDGEIIEEWVTSVGSAPHSGQNSWAAHIQALES